MTPLDYELLVFGALCGYLIWRRSRKLIHSILTAIATPIIVLTTINFFVAHADFEIIAKANFESVLKTILLSGVIVTLCVVVYVYREK